MTDERSLPIGEWVQVWAQVVDERAHPEDVVVEMFSHNEQFRAIVRADRVIVPTEPPFFAGRCTHLCRATDDRAPLWRCERHDGHAAPHVANRGQLEWGNDLTAGWIEETP